MRISLVRVSYVLPSCGEVNFLRIRDIFKSRYNTESHSKYAYQGVWRTEKWTWDKGGSTVKHPTCTAIRLSCSVLGFLKMSHTLPSFAHTLSICPSNKVMHSFFFFFFLHFCFCKIKLELSAYAFLVENKLSFTDRSKT